MSEEKTIEPGCWWFLTVSLDIDFVPSEKILQYCRKVFSEHYGVIEHGDSGKAHFHLVGYSIRRQDNMKSGMTKLLEKEDYTTGQWSVDLRAEPRAEWRMGYLMKELDSKVVLSNIEERVLEKGKLCYETSPKRERKELKAGKFNVNKLMDLCRQSCHSHDDVINFINDCAEPGVVDFSQWQKINWKRFRQYALKNYSEE